MGISRYYPSFPFYGLIILYFFGVNVNKLQCIFPAFYAYIFEKNGVCMRLCELRQKEIINIRTCRSLGCPIDLEFDERSGKITALIVPGPGDSAVSGDGKVNLSSHGAASVRSEEISPGELPEEKCPHR